MVINWILHEFMELDVEPKFEYKFNVLAEGRGADLLAERPIEAAVGRISQ